MCQKGLDWADCFAVKPLPRRDAWFSFDHQLFMSMSWGLVAVVLPPEKLEEMMQSLYYCLLHLLGVNRCITKEWQMLPARFHGLGLPSFVVVAFAKKVFYVQCHWGATDAPGYMLQWAYEKFVVKVGLYGDSFDWDYERFNSLATEGTWMKNLWQLCQLLGVQVELDE